MGKTKQYWSYGNENYFKVVSSVKEGASPISEKEKITEKTRREEIDYYGNRYNARKFY